MGEGESGGLRVHFDTRVRVEFQGAKVTSDAGLVAVPPTSEWRFGGGRVAYLAHHDCPHRPNLDSGAGFVV